MLKRIRDEIAAWLEAKRLLVLENEFLRERLANTEAQLTATRQSAKYWEDVYVETRDELSALRKATDGRGRKT